MIYISGHSSIVMIGDSFVVGALDVGKHKGILGELDSTRTIVMPVLASYSFKDSAFNIQLEPQKIQIDYRDTDILPKDLITIGKAAAKALSSGSPQGVIRAIGFNVDVVISAEELGISGVDYCAKHFIADRSIWDKILLPDNSFSAAGRVVYNKDNVKYTIRFEPHYKSDMNNLYVDINAHQAIEPPVTYSSTLNRYNSIRSYILDVMQNALVVD